MAGFLLDTNFLSEFARALPANPRVDAWLKATPDEFLFASVLTFAEIRRGLELLPVGKRRTHLEEWHADLKIAFHPRLLPVTKAIAAGNESVWRWMGDLIRAGATKANTSRHYRWLDRRHRPRTRSNRRNPKWERFRWFGHRTLQSVGAVNNIDPPHRSTILRLANLAHATAQRTTTLPTVRIGSFRRF